MIIYDIVGRNCTEIAVFGQYAILLSLKNIIIIIVILDRNAWLIKQFHAPVPLNSFNI